MSRRTLSINPIGNSLDLIGRNSRKAHRHLRPCSFDRTFNWVLKYLDQRGSGAVECAVLAEDYLTAEYLLCHEFISRYVAPEWAVSTYVTAFNGVVQNLLNIRKSSSNGVHSRVFILSSHLSSFNSVCIESVECAAKVV